MTLREIEKQDLSLSMAALEVATGLNAQTIRSWYQRGVLDDPSSKNGAHRRFSVLDAQFLTILRLLIDGGIPTADAAPLAKELSSFVSRRLRFDKLGEKTPKAALDSLKKAVEGLPLESRQLRVAVIGVRSAEKEGSPLDPRSKGRTFEILQSDFPQGSALSLAQNDCDSALLFSYYPVVFRFYDRLQELLANGGA